MFPFIGVCGRGYVWACVSMLCVHTCTRAFSFKNMDFYQVIDKHRDRYLDEYNAIDIIG